VRDKFVGDIGDYGKYGLLRALSGVVGNYREEKLRLGIVWCFVADKGIRYLDDPELSRCDPMLFKTLSSVVKKQTRTIRAIQGSGVLPGDTTYFATPMEGGVRFRKVWGEHAAEKTSDCDLIFFDPDNGLKSSRLGEGSVSSKHVYCEELMAFVSRGQSLVVYHHRPLMQRVEVEADARVRELTERLSCSQVWALRHGERFYFIIPNGRDDLLRRRLGDFLQRPWGEHFELFPRQQRTRVIGGADG